MNDPEVLAETRQTLDAVLAKHLTTPVLLRAALGEAPVGALREKLAEMALAGLGVPERLGGVEASDAMVAELFGVAGQRLLPHALRQETMLLGPALAMLAGDGVAQSGSLLDRHLAGKLNGAGAAVLPELDAPAARIIDGRRRMRVRTWVAGSPEVVAIISGSWIALLPAEAVGPRATGTHGVDGGHHWYLIDVDDALLSTATVREVDARNLVDRWLLATFAELQGVADRVLTTSLDYAQQRHQFGRPISGQQAIAHRLADMAARVESGAAAVSRHVESLATADRDRIADEQRVLQYWAPAMAREVCEHAIQVHGGTGFTWEYGLHLYYRRALALQALFGGAQHAARRVAAPLVPARALTGEDSR